MNDPRTEMERTRSAQDARYRVANLLQTPRSDAWTTHYGVPIRPLFNVAYLGQEEEWNVYGMKCVYLNGRKGYFYSEQLHAAAQELQAKLGPERIKIEDTGQQIPSLKIKIHSADQESLDVLQKIAAIRGANTCSWQR